MARNLTPIVKPSRREGVALAPKAVKGPAKHLYKPGWARTYWFAPQAESVWLSCARSRRLHVRSA